MKCPACGFETPESQGWCDFCKEPFRKKAADVPPPPSREPISTASSSAINPAMPHPPSPSAPPGPAGGPPPPLPDLLHLDSGEKIPVLPPYVRWLAWAFLAAWMFGLMGLALSLTRRARTLPGGEGPRAPGLPR